MKYLKSLLLTAIISLIIITPVFPQNILTIGNDAPAIKYTKWIKGKSIEQFEKGKIYVVEFWATWCAPCKETIPHLTGMANKFKDKVTFIGVAIGERGPDEASIIKLVTGFVEKMGDKMDYNVALDTKDGFMSKNWMDAAVQNGIPFAFIINKDTKIEWIGYPSDEMSNVLSKIIDGTFDSKAYAVQVLESQKKDLKENKLKVKFKSISKDLIEANKNKDYKKVIEECEKIVIADPELSLLTDIYYAKALAVTNPDKAIEAAQKSAAKSDGSVIAFLDAFVNEKNKKLSEFVITTSNEILVKDSKNYQLLYILAETYESDGNKEKTIETLEKLVSVLREMKFEEKNIQGFTDRIEKLKEGK